MTPRELDLPTPPDDTPAPTPFIPPSAPRVSRERWRFAMIYPLLLVMLGLGAYALVGVATSHRTVTVTHTRTADVSSTAALEQALGKPDGAVAGEQISPQLKGTTCDVYQSRKSDLVLVCHA